MIPSLLAFGPARVPVAFVLGLLLSAAPLLAAPSAAGAPSTRASSTARSEGSVIILGFDGADGRTAQAMMDAGELPNLQRLREQGTFSPLGTSAPAESPVSWASLNTGQNPAKTGVPGFIVNDGLLKSRAPSPGFGHLVTRRGSNAVPIEEFTGETMVPLWSPTTLAGVAFGACALAFFVVFAGLLRMNKLIALMLSLVLGAGGGVAGWIMRGYLPSKIPKTENPNQARNLWDFAAEGGVDSIVLDAAQAFDQDCPEGAQVLAGLGLPDARGGIGEWFIYTTDDLEFDRPPAGRKDLTAGEVFRVDERGGVIETVLYGPMNFWEEDKLQQEYEALQAKLDSPKLGYKESTDLRDRERDLKEQLSKFSGNEGRTSVELKVEIAGGKAAVTLGGQTQTLAEGEWSDWYSITFGMNPILKVHAITRCRIMSLEDPFKLYIDKLDIDPKNPPFWQPASKPPGFARELAKSFGPFETYGWSTMTMPFKDKEIPTEMLLEDVEFTLGWRERLVYEALQRDDWRLFMGVFSTTDRVQHMMYQYYDPEHPLYDPAVASTEVQFFGKSMTYADAIPEIYRQMDRVVGTVMDQYMGPDDTLLVCSDHGFQSFRRQAHINEWLVERGYMKLASDVKAGTATWGLNGRYIDWSETQAYSFGLGFIYLNLEGREPDGIVKPADKEALIARIRADLLAEVDPETGLHIATNVYVTADEHQGGAYLEKEADLIVGFAPPYRVAWTTSGGGIKLETKENGEIGPVALFSDNTSPWSGGHVSMDLDAVRGIFFSNRKVALPAGGPNLLHIAPTVLGVLGVAVPSAMDLGPLEFLD